MSDPIETFEEAGVVYSRDERAGKEMGWTEGVYTVESVVTPGAESNCKVWFIGGFKDLCVLVNLWNASGDLWKYTALYAGEAGGYEKNQR